MSADQPEWTILLTHPGGLLRWRPQPFQYDHDPIGCVEDDLTADADRMSIEESNQETARSRTFAQQWVPRLRRLGLIGPPRIPSLPTEEIPE